MGSRCFVQVTKVADKLSTQNKLPKHYTIIIHNKWLGKGNILCETTYSCICGIFFIASAELVLRGLSAVGQPSFFRRHSTLSQPIIVARGLNETDFSATHSEAQEHSWLSGSNGI